jgi:hydrogenase maturation protein HypF
MMRNNVSCVQSSSTGRLFDGVAALLGLCRENRFDSEAPMALESAAVHSGYCVKADEAGFRLRESDGLIDIDLTPLIQRIARRAPGDESPADLAMLFHQTLAAAWSAAVSRATQTTGLSTVALGGGVFGNELFGELLGRRLGEIGVQVLRNRAVPPNDGGIAFGQAAVAAARVKRASPRE